MSIQIKEAKETREITEYIKFAWKIYRTDEELNKYWVPHLISDYQKTLDIKEFPLWEHAERACFTAWKDGNMVGTITAVINHRHLQFHQDGVGFWGFFECINDEEVSQALFNTAEKWLKEKGLTAMRGPISPSMNDQVGMLSFGYNASPVFLMTYNPPYYHSLCKAYGFSVAQELLSWIVNKHDLVPSFNRMKRISSFVKKKENITIRKVNMKNYEHEIQNTLSVYNKAWELNWGFVPMTEKEFTFLAKNLKQIVNPDLVFFAENDKKQTIAFSISLPDMNTPLKHTNGNYLTPTGLIKFLWHRRKITKIRTIVLGVVKEYRNKGIESVFISETIENAMKIGITECELGWVLESNEAMNKLAKAIEAKVDKRYLVYEKKI